MTPREPMTNAQALTNAKQVFAAALEGKDAERFGFDAWPENAANGFDFTTNWTLSQNEQGEVTLTAVDPDTKEKAVLTYTPNAAEPAFGLRYAHTDKAGRRTDFASFAECGRGFFTGDECEPHSGL